MPDGLVVSFEAGSACHWKVWFSAALVEMLNEDATKSCGREFLPAVAVAVPVAGSFSAPATFTDVVPVCVTIEF